MAPMSYEVREARLKALEARTKRDNALAKTAGILTDILVKVDTLLDYEVEKAEEDAKR